jgi:hypothetical protein
MTVVIINMAGQAVRFTGAGGYKVENNCLHVLNEMGIPFLTVAAGMWQGVQNEDELKKYESRVTAVGGTRGGVPTGNSGRPQ